MDDTEEIFERLLALVALLYINCFRFISFVLKPFWFNFDRRSIGREFFIKLLLLFALVALLMLCRFVDLVTLIFPIGPKRLWIFEEEGLLFILTEEDTEYVLGFSVVLALWLFICLLMLFLV